MSGGWKGSTRKERLPANWPALVTAVHQRSGGKCEVYSQSRRRVCGRPADGGVDHIIPNDDDSLSNLQNTCHWHHAAKTAAEAQAAKQRKAEHGKLPQDPHPGRLRRKK